jgi:hypothetical protein
MNPFKNIVFYYFVIFLPLVLIVWSLRFDFFKTGLGVSMFFFYAFMYRPYVDFKRLEAKGIVTRFNYFDMILIHMKFFKELYWI